jgi:hypothetical protein
VWVGGASFPSGPVSMNRWRPLYKCCPSTSARPCLVWSAPSSTSIIHIPHTPPSSLLLLVPQLAQVAVETPAKLQRYQGGVGQLLAAGGWPDVSHLAACCSPDTRVRRG